MNGFFSLLSEASEPITKLLGKFFVVEIFRRISWFRIKSGSVSLSRFDLWVIVVDPSERRTAPGAICTPDRPYLYFKRSGRAALNFFFFVCPLRGAGPLSSRGVPVDCLTDT